tara:strand:+ start:3063 stop:3362 length:300 start_codon:yes stop_codon:yes gene_type:complete
MNNNFDYVDNKEIFNKRLFDRNILNSELRSKLNEKPLYFDKNLSNNKIIAQKKESFFEKQFALADMNLNKPNEIDFKKNNLDNQYSKIEFRGNYKDYLN